MSAWTPLVYHEAEWPYGLQCMDCGHGFTEWEGYSRRLTGFVRDMPVCDVICAACALGMKP